MELAQEWILRGNPVRFGSLTLADFFPTEADLQSIGLHVGVLLKREYERGVRDGYRQREIDQERQDKISEVKTLENEA